ncbi:hypothetical protein ACGE0T_09025 [Parabacteroides sp. APC149_11_2_Y6]
MKIFKYCVLLFSLAGCSSSNELNNGIFQITFSNTGKLEEVIVSTEQGPKAMDMQTPERKGEVYLKSMHAGSWLEPEKTKNEKDKFIQYFSSEDGDISLTYCPYGTNTFLVKASFVANVNLDSLAIGIRFFAIQPELVEACYCLPLSLPFLREDSLNKIPDGYISNGETFNNTFSLITRDETYSVSVLPPDFRLDPVFDATAASDYRVGFKPQKKTEPDKPELADGSITVLCNHNRKINKGEIIERGYLVSADLNTPGGYATGYHIGEYMNKVDYKKTDNLIDIYRKSMDYLLNNPHCFGKIGNSAANYFGAMHTQTAQPFDNGTAFYAMYGNSFSAAALNQYKQIQPNAPDNLQIRLNAVNDFLLKSDVLTKEGAYWSMLDLRFNKGYVDQAYKKWIETHATGWVTYYLLEAYGISKDKTYLPVIEKTLKWMANEQLPDGSFPKYFEKGIPSEKKLGDIAWMTLAFFKAAESGIAIPGIDLKKQALLSAEWILTNLVPQKQYQGSFEDVGGVNDSYCPSITARALIEAYRQSHNKMYLNAAEDALSVALSWITCGYTMDGKSMDTWSETYRFQPAYAQVESTSCYWPCSYTLPALFLAAGELALQIQEPDRKAYWTQLSSRFNYVSAYLLDNQETKGRFGMEWLLSPFLVFSEWGNSQLCWSVLETLRIRILMSLPEFKLNSLLSGIYKGNSYSIILPKWSDNDFLLSINKDVEPVTFKNISGHNCIFLLSEGQHVNDKLSCGRLLGLLPSSVYKMKNLQTGEFSGEYTTEQLLNGIDISFTDFLFFELVPKER